MFSAVIPLFYGWVKTQQWSAVPALLLLLFGWLSFCLFFTICSVLFDGHGIIWWSLHLLVWAVYRGVPREWSEPVFRGVTADSDSCSVLRMSSLLARPTASEETMALAFSQFLWVNRSVQMIRIPTLCINNSLKLTWTFKGKIHEVSSHWLTAG